MALDPPTLLILSIALAAAAALYLAIEWRNVRVTLSIGASLFDQPPASLAALIEQGDAALYESKRGGRNSIRLVDRTRVRSLDGPTASR